MIWSRRKLLGMLGLATAIMSLLSKRSLAFLTAMQSSPEIFSDDFPPESPVNIISTIGSETIPLERFATPEVPLVIYYPYLPSVLSAKADQQFLALNNNATTIHSPEEMETDGANGGDAIPSPSESSPVSSEPESGIPFNVVSISHLSIGLVGAVLFHFSEELATQEDCEALITNSTSFLGQLFPMGRILATNILGEYTDPEILKYPWARKLYTAQITQIDSAVGPDPFYLKQATYIGEAEDSAFYASVSVSGSDPEHLEESWQMFFGYSATSADNDYTRTSTIADIILSNIRLRSD
ncbi:MAG: hypothetical protein AAFW75_20565 [Cyanobacteria bacterium J06636_16]